MKVHQLSLFIENRPGQLSAPCRLLSDAGINIRTLALAETEKFGILRLIVDNWQKAKSVLESGGCVVKVTEVVGIEVPDRPGGLSGILTALDREGLNVEYMYAFTEGREGRAVMIFRFGDTDRAIAALQKGGISLVARPEIQADLGETAGER